MASVELNAEEFRKWFPGLAEGVIPDELLGFLWEQVCEIVGNTDATSIAPYDPEATPPKNERKTLLYYALCHFATLTNRGDQPGRIASASEGSVSTSFDLIQSSERRLSEISINSNPETAESYKVANKLSDVIGVMLEKLEGEYKNENVETGIDLLDKYTNGGFQKSDYIIVAARPSVGKTAFAVSLIRNMIRKGTKVAFFSLEMPSTQIISRLLSCTSKVDLSKIFTGNLTEADIAAAEHHDAFAFYIRHLVRLTERSTTDCSQQHHGRQHPRQIPSRH